MIKAGYKQELSNTNVVLDYVREDGVVEVTFIKWGVECVYTPGEFSKKRYIFALAMGLIQKKVREVRIGNPMIYERVTK